MSQPELPADAPAPRLAHVVKWEDFDGYGFNLHADKSKAGQYIGKVDDFSPAEKAGLLEGDKIVEVNGVNISNENHQQVVQRIKLVLNETKLLVVSPEVEKWYKANTIVIRGDQENIIHGTSQLEPSSDVIIKETIDVISNEPIDVTEKNDVVLNGDVNSHQEGDDSRSVASAESSHSGGSSTQPQAISPAPIIEITQAPDFSPRDSLEPELEKSKAQDENSENAEESKSDKGQENDEDKNNADFTVDNFIDELVKLSDEKEEEARQNKMQEEPQDIYGKWQDQNEDQKEYGNSEDNKDVNAVDGDENHAVDGDKQSLNSTEELSTTVPGVEDTTNSSTTGRRGSVSSSNSAGSSPASTSSPVNSEENEKSPMSITPTPPPSIDPVPNANTNHTTTTTTTSTPPPPSQTQNGTAQISNKMGGLNLNMTVAEMRAHLATKKKFDPRKDTIDIKKKYEIIQNM